MRLSIFWLGTLFFLQVSSTTIAANWNQGNSTDASSATSVQLNCKTTKYQNSGYSEEWSKSWVPPTFSLVVSGGIVELLGRNVKGRVTRDSNDRIEISFDDFSSARNDGGYL